MEKNNCSFTIDEKTRYLTEQRVAEITGFALPTLRNWRFARKGIPYSKLGKSVRYKSEDVFSFMERHRVEVGHECQ